ncbi:hypothetical protein KKC91_04825 [bacterium]|nr:hypothetical protein [bacterium]
MAIKTDRDMRKSKDFQELNVPIAERKRIGYVEDRELVKETKISFFAIQNYIQTGLLEIDAETPYGRKLFKKDKALKRLKLLTHMQKLHPVNELKNTIYDPDFNENEFLDKING